MKSYIKYISVLFCAAFAMSGCINDTLTEEPAGNGYVEVEFAAAVDSQQQAGTRALSITQENHIETLDVLVFEYDAAADGQGVFLYSTHGIGIQSSGTNTKTFKAMLATRVTVGGTSIDLTGKTVFIHLIANAREIWNSASVSYGDSFGSVTRKLVYRAAANWDATPSSTQYFPMDSDIRQTCVTLSGDIKGSDFGTIQLYRAVTTLDIGFNYGSGTTPQGFDKFKLKTVAVRNMADRGYVSAHETYSLRNSVRVPADRVLMEREYTLTTPSKTGFFNEIYLPETEAIRLSTGNYPYLLIGGYYTEPDALVENTTELSWYKIDVPTVVLSSVEYSMPFCRNHRYVFRVNDITGPGYDSKEDAVEGDTSTLLTNVNIVPWSESTHYDDIDGPYHFDVSQTEFAFDYYEVISIDPGNELTLYTNYAGGWKVDSITYEGDQRDWLTLSATEGEPFQTGHITLTMTRNWEQKERVCYIRVTAGRWDYTIKVVQRKMSVA